MVVSEMVEEAGFRYPVALTQGDFGHGTTPKHPEDALRYPLAYQAYIARNKEKLEDLVSTNEKARRIYEVSLQRIDSVITPQEIRKSPIILPFLDVVYKPPPRWTRRPTVSLLLDAVNYALDVAFLNPVAVKNQGGTYTIFLPPSSPVPGIKPSKRKTQPKTQGKS